MISIIFCKKKGFTGWLSGIIRMWTKSKYSHCAIRFKRANNYFAIHSNSKGVSLNEYNEWAKSYIILDIVDMYLPQEEEDKVVQYCLDQEGKGYGFLQFAGIVLYDLTGLKPFMNGDRKHICSELIARALNLKYEQPLDFVDPQELYDKISKK